MFKNSKRRQRKRRLEENLRKKLGEMIKPSDDEIRIKLAFFYNSEYVAINQPWVLKVPQDEWIERQIRLRKLGEAASQ